MNDEPILKEEPIEENMLPQPESKKNSLVSSLFDIVEMFAWSVFAVLIIFSFAFRLCRVDGQSMENTLYNEQNLLLYSLSYTPAPGDIIVFHLTAPEVNMEKTLVKRVIATGGQTVEINTNTKEIKIDGVVYTDPYPTFKNPEDHYKSSLFDYNLDHSTGIFTATVPEGFVFVMGDNRNNSKDSRDNDVGFIDERCILGKAILRLSPFTSFS